MRINPAFDLHPQQNDPAKIDKVARQLEGQFAQMLVKSMRDASFGDSLFPGENKMFREMYDQKIAEAMTRGKGGLGLSGMISRQLSGQAADGPALDTRVDPAKASRAYQLNAPAKPAPSLPLEDGSQAVRLLQRWRPAPSPAHTRRCTDGTGAGPDRRARKQQHAPPARHRRSLHRQPAGRGGGRQRPVGGDRQQPRHISPADAMAAAVAQLGEHTPEGFV
jgi:flagellar protein FlgJ